MKLYSYIVRIDRGLAPNPFWGYCTLAVCTPNHMGIHPERGDWVIGTSPANRNNKLIYAMQVSEVLRFDKYYTDLRFEKKKPNVKGSWCERCGDNMYYLDKGEWKQHRTIHHRTPETRNKDLRYPFVYIAEHFYYFGDKTIKVPAKYQELVWKRQGCSGRHNPAIVEAFLVWLQKNFKPGILGNPMDNEEATEGTC